MEFFMTITPPLPASPKITRDDYRATIKIPTLEGLCNAIFTYAGETPLAQQFAQKVAQTIKDQNGNFEGDWDYRYPNVNHKAGIHTAANPDGTYSLSIIDHNYTTKQDINLAKTLGAPVGFYEARVKQEFATTGQRFSIPLTAIAQVYQALGVKFDAQEFLKAVSIPNIAHDSGESFPGSHITSYASPVKLIEDGKKHVSINLYDVAQGFHFRDEPNRDFGFCIEDGNLIGPSNAHKWSQVSSPAKLTFIARPFKGNTYDTALEAELVAMGDAVERAWKGEEPKPSAKNGAGAPQFDI